MTVEDYKQLNGNLFNDEPLSTFFEKKLKELPEARKKEKDDYHIRLVENGTCVVAINEDDNGRIVGWAPAYGQDPSDLEEKRRGANDMRCPSKVIIRLLCDANIKSNLFERYGVPRILVSYITNVVESLRGRGLGSRLTAALMEVGRSKGFSLMTASCTSFYSARQKEALEMECVYSQSYEDYKDANGKLVLSLPAPHTHLGILAIKL